jgi:hypothetical protein
MSGNDSRRTASALARIDTLAFRLIAQARPLRFGVAQSPAELEAVYRLRYRVVIEQDWAQPKAFSNGLERDAYDDRAIQIVGWDGVVPAATSRLVLPLSEQLLPTEDTFGLAVQPVGQVVDVGRVCVAPPYRGMNPCVFWALLAQTWIEMRARGFTEACGALAASIVRMVQSCGLQVEILGAARLVWGKARLPAHVQPAPSIHMRRRMEEHPCPNSVLSPHDS